MTVDVQLLIDGEQVSCDERAEVLNPARPGEVVGTAALARREHAEQAVEAARCAFPEWAQTSVADRASLIVKAANAAAFDEDERARLLTREQGKILSEARGEVALFGRLMQLALPFVDNIATDRTFDDPARGGRLVATLRPRGPAVAITAWNWPLAQTAQKLGSMLLAGNTVVVKPALECPLTVLQTLERVVAELPPGVVNVLTGTVPEIGGVLTGHSDVRHISFTGSVASGAAVARAAAANITNVTLELGGNDPAILLDDVEIDDRMILRLLQGAFTGTGQGCQLIKRLYVHRSRYDDLVARMLEVMNRTYVVGDGLKDEVTMGPLCTARQRDFVEGLVGDACRGGATATEAGRRHDSAVSDGGFFLMPTLVTDAADSDRIVEEEQFGPALPVLAFDNDDEAVRRANSTRYGLAASVWSADPERAWHVARRIEAGTVLINHHNVFVALGDAAFGGVKESGIGREGGLTGLEELMDLAVITDRKR